MSIAQEERQDSQEENPFFQSTPSPGDDADFPGEYDYPDSEGEGAGPLAFEEEDLPSPTSQKSPTGFRGEMSPAYAAELNDRELIDELEIDEEEGCDPTPPNTPSRQPGEVATILPEEMEEEEDEKEGDPPAKEVGTALCQQEGDDGLAQALRWLFEFAEME